MNLLHEDYHIDPKKIKVFNNRYLFVIYGLLKEFDIGYIKDAFYSRTKGTYRTGDDNILIFTYDLNGKRHALNTIATFYHELRHYYQHNYKTNKFNLNSATLHMSENGYNTQPHERDANRFASRMMNKHRKKLSELTDTFNWNTTL
ncbi:DUF3920 family protein [Priestia filamentosa]|nr:DUF3920 family protein [Priestia filamentosa]